MVKDLLSEIPTVRGEIPIQFKGIHRIVTDFKIEPENIPIIKKQIIRLRESLGFVRGENKRKLVDGKFVYVERTGD